MNWRVPLSLIALSLPIMRAEAHAELVRALPEPGAVVEPLFSEIRLTFDEPLAPGSSITLFAEGFQKVPGIRPQLEDVDMFAKIPAALAPGLLTIQWTAVSDDGHASEGSYQLRVAEGLAHASWMWWLVIALPALSAFAWWRRTRRSGGVNP